MYIYIHIYCAGAARDGDQRGLEQGECRRGRRDERSRKLSVPLSLCLSLSHSLYTVSLCISLPLARSLLLLISLALDRALSLSMYI